jgi:hypothetical protein
LSRAFLPEQLRLIPGQKCKQAEQWARPDRCCDRLLRTSTAERSTGARYLFRFALFRAPFLALVDFLAFFAAIFRDSCHISIGCLNLKKRSNTPPTSEERGDRSNMFLTAGRDPAVFNRVSTVYQQRRSPNCGVSSSILIFLFVESVNRNFLYFNNLSEAHPS